MIVAKTPLRVSYLGGGSDYQEHIRDYESAFIGTTIDKFVYVAINKLEMFTEQAYRFTYRTTESVQSYSDFKHPVVKAALEHFKWDTHLNISTLADLPGGTGLGSSSSFTVSLIHALHEFNNTKVDPHTIAKLAILIEREKLQEVGGIQDQVHAAFGGLKGYVFSQNNSEIFDFGTKMENINYLSDRQWLVPLGESRSSASASQTVIDSSPDIVEYRKIISSKAKEAIYKLQIAKSESEFYATLVSAVNDSWNLKSQLIGMASPEIKLQIDSLKQAGADAVKLCGGGVSGFALVLCEPTKIAAVARLFPPHWLINARSFHMGSSVIRL